MAVFDVHTKKTVDFPSGLRFGISITKSPESSKIISVKCLPFPLLLHSEKHEILLDPVEADFSENYTIKDNNGVEWTVKLFKYLQAPGTTNFKIGLKLRKKLIELFAPVLYTADFKN